MRGLSEKRRTCVAYSFNDLFRPLRLSMRINGAVIGFGLGLSFIFAPLSGLVNHGVLAGAPSWPARLIGALLIGMGVFFILAATDRIIETPTLITTIVANGLVAIVLLVAYLQGDFGQLFLLGRVILVIVVALSLVGAVLPLRYLAAEYRT